MAFPDALDPFLAPRSEIFDFGREASAAGIRYLGVCCGAGPHHIRAVADRFAALGYTSLAPALFDRAKRGVDIGYDEAAMKQGVELRMHPSTKRTATIGGRAAVAP